jgi:hypothetical protein
MEQSNLAAAILHCAGSCTNKQPRNQLTNEEAISLADWLRFESSISAWRHISLPLADSPQ